MTQGDLEVHGSFLSDYFLYTKLRTSLRHMRRKTVRQGGFKKKIVGKKKIIVNVINKAKLVFGVTTVKKKKKHHWSQL